MTESLHNRIIDFLLTAPPKLRKEYCRDEPEYFAMYYFSEYFDYKIPKFHFDFYQDIKDLKSGVLEEAMWCTFRDSAKTSIAKIAFATWLICYKHKRYINWDSYDGDNGEAALFDITVALQTNKKIIRDFGQLYYKKKEKDALVEAKMKRIKSFITENGVRIQSFTTQESTRGRLYGSQRPDCFIFDDFENTITRDSYPKTLKIKAHIDELKAGLPANACVLYLCNYITEEGSVAYIMEKIKDNPRGRLRFIPVKDKETGLIAWPDKFVDTALEASTLNAAIKDSRKWKIALDSKRKTLGASNYEAEMMNNPAHGPDKVFDRDTIDAFLKVARGPAKDVAGFKTWYDYNPSHRYAIGADTAKGIGKDANASCLIDFSTSPARVVGTYKNNLMPPDVFGNELANQGRAYGECLIAPENNNTGHATITTLKRIYPTAKMYVPLQDEKVKEILATDYGFETNGATKPEIMYQLKAAVEAGHLDVFDKDLLNEMKHFAQKDMKIINLVEGMTRHYDLLMACAIAWAMRDYAKVAVAKKAVRQGAHIPAAGEYGG